MKEMEKAGEVEEVVFTAKKINGEIFVDSKSMQFNELCQIGYTAFNIAKKSLENSVSNTKKVSLKKFIQTCMKNQL